MQAKESVRISGGRKPAQVDEQSMDKSRNEKVRELKELGNGLRVSDPLAPCQ
jgi:hypothetical protein